ncbi:MAG: hypothetical protein IT279_11665 [Ignavibacteriaceae bacterium]|nr:hypothetical protein [Ignavibacteriaceae bacterium]
MARNRILNLLLFWAALSLFALSTTSCSEPASPFGQTDITLTSLDGSCTEVWLELKFSNLTEPAIVAIQKDGKIVIVTGGQGTKAVLTMGRK